MKITIEHDTVTLGLFRKKTHYRVKCTVQFSQEELHVIKSKDLGDKIVLNRPPMSVLNSAPDADIDALRIRHFISGKGDTHTFATPGEARDYDEEVKEGLPKLKAFIENNSDIKETKTSFEL